MEDAQKCYDNRMRRVAEREGTAVYNFAYDEQRRQASPEVCVNLARRTIEAREKIPSNIGLIEAGLQICKEDPVLQEFSQNFPKIFAYMLDPETCGDKLAMLEKMARVQKDVVNRTLSETEAKVHVSRLVMEKTMREPNEEEKKRHNIS